MATARHEHQKTANCCTQAHTNRQIAGRNAKAATDRYAKGEPNARGYTLATVARVSIEHGWFVS